MTTRITQSHYVKLKCTYYKLKVTGFLTSKCVQMCILTIIKMAASHYAFINRFVVAIWALSFSCCKIHLVSLCLFKQQDLYLPLPDFVQLLWNSSSFSQDSDVSDVTWHTAKYGYHTQNLCSAINPSNVYTHSSEYTHTQSSGQPFMLRRPGSSWRFGALLKGT